MNLKNKKVGFVGAGNMATAIIKGMLNSKIVDSKNLYIADKDKSKLESMQTLGVNITNDNMLIASESDIIIIAVKPGIYPIVLEEIAVCNNIGSKIIVSIAAGISIGYMKSFFSEAVKVVRTMPNTPALIGAGMTVISCKPPVTDEELLLVDQIFASVGNVEHIDEDYMNEIVAVNGSSPAYVYMMIEAMADAAVMRGIPRELAYRLVAQSVLGSAKMVLETNKHPGELKDMVCSPGGTTIQAVYHLEQTGFRASLMGAMEKCTEKAIELNQKYIK